MTILIRGRCPHCGEPRRPEVYLPETGELRLRCPQVSVCGGCGGVSVQPERGLYRKATEGDLAQLTAWQRRRVAVMSRVIRTLPAPHDAETEAEFDAALAVELENAGCGIIQQ